MTTKAKHKDPEPQTSAVMLIDDQPDWLRINCRALEKAGYPCKTYTNPNDALAEFKKSPRLYPLVIIDVNLGSSKDGIEIGMGLLDHTPGTHVVLISSTDQLRKHEKSLEAMAKKHEVIYARKEGDEVGGEQVVKIAKHTLPLLAGGKALPSASPVRSPGGLMVWLQSKPEDTEEGTKP